MLKLNLKQNALHSLHHAVESMYMADSEEDLETVFDEDTEWFEDGGSYTPPPAVYKLKFALLHLIQSAELILKAYIANIDPQAIFEPSKNPHKKPITIKMEKALQIINEHKPNLLSEDERKLLNSAKGYRNDIEHHEFIFPKAKMKQLCVDFLALCAFLTQSLLSKNLIDLFDYDALRNRTDPVSDFLSRVLNGTSSLGRTALVRTGMMWVDDNSSEKFFLCFSCNKKTVLAARGVCMGCGAEGDEEGSRLIEEMEAVMFEYQAIKEHIRKKSNSMEKNLF